MFSHLPDVPESEPPTSATTAAKMPGAASGELSILTELQFRLYKELHAAAGKLVRPPARPDTQSSDLARLSAVMKEITGHSETFSVLWQAYSHLANAALADGRVNDRLLAMSGVQHGPGGSLLKRLLRFAAADVPARSAQRYIADFLEIADAETVRATLSQIAGMEWAVDPDDAHQIMTMDTTDGVVTDVQEEVRRFRVLLHLDADSGTPTGACLASAEHSAWGPLDWHRIQTWRRRYVAAHTANIDWAMTKATVYRKEREPLAPYWHPGGLEAAVVTQLRQEADRAASARLVQITDAVAQMALRRVERRAGRQTTPFDPRHLPSGGRGMLFLDTPFTLPLPTGRRIVGYVWGPWAPALEEGWGRLGAGRDLKPLEIPQGGTPWTWVTPLTCDQSLLSLPFSPYSTLLLRPGDVLEPATRLRDPEHPDRHRAGTGRLAREELLIRHVRSLWELLTQHKRSSVHVLAEEVHTAKPRDQRSDRRRGITDSGHVTTVWVDPDAGERYRAQRRSEGGSGYKLKVRYWRGEHERQQCPNPRKHAERLAEGGCTHDEITIPEHPVGPAGAPWSDQVLRARSRRPRSTSVGEEP
ncbi:hypothetical protein [Streptomyces niveus]|uniref:hypothetical protein n=1 Tax=Streptomyces niveus TaxID=193462 RepID=UPI0033D35255